MVVCIEKDRRTLENFLKSNTTYDVDFIFKTKSLTQIFAMCQSIEEAMRKYPKEIAKYIKENPSCGANMSIAELYSLTYNELVSIRKSLGIKNTRKKVTNTTPAPSETNQLGLECIAKTETRDLCYGIISSNESNRDLQILTQDEIREMYGGEELSPEDLAKRGIISDAVVYHEPKEDPELERLNIIDEILTSKITIFSTELSLHFLYTLAEEELNNLLKVVRNFKKYEDKNKKRLKK